MQNWLSRYVCWKQLREFHILKKYIMFSDKKNHWNLQSNGWGVDGSHSFVPLWNKASEKYLNSCVFGLELSHEKMLFELTLLSTLQRIYGCGSPASILNAMRSPELFWTTADLDVVMTALPRLTLNTSVTEEGSQIAPMGIHYGYWHINWQI